MKTGPNSDKTLHITKSLSNISKQYRLNDKIFKIQSARKANTDVFN
ncbi:MAG: hypothetical protein LBJ32_03010 [Oscillospiraceae bacterium]|nr:hypothetical protein [Oscillospiraceae bacterium]